MPKIFIPTLHTFAMNNIFTGSCGAFRFRAAPQVVMKTPKEVDMESSSIVAECWHGPWCYEKSTMEDRQEFPMSEEGRQALLQWLTERV
ncbi:MAG TPA: hypothetical protein IAC31_07675 [Candidatus Faecousia intestinigallinarum]|nr:hypothetical protein [Candidatus Faecousia intestinigallinarum]